MTKTTMNAKAVHPRMRRRAIFSTTALIRSKLACASGCAVTDRRWRTCSPTLPNACTRRPGYTDMIYAAKREEIESRRKAFLCKCRLKCRALAVNAFAFTQLPRTLFTLLIERSLLGTGPQLSNCFHRREREKVACR